MKTSETKWKRVDSDYTFYGYQDGDVVYELDAYGHIIHYHPILMVNKVETSKPSKITSENFRLTQHSDCIDINIEMQSIQATMSFDLQAVGLLIKELQRIRRNQRRGDENG